MLYKFLELHICIKVWIKVELPKFMAWQASHRCWIGNWSVTRASLSNNFSAVKRINNFRQHMYTVYSSYPYSFSFGDLWVHWSTFNMLHVICIDEKSTLRIFITVYKHLYINNVHMNKHIVLSWKLALFGKEIHSFVPTAYRHVWGHNMSQRCHFQNDIAFYLKSLKKALI